MRNFVISLSSAYERRTHIEKEFGTQSIDFEFFDAIQPDNARILAKEIFPDCDLNSISPMELACAMSHIAIWLKAKQEHIEFFSIFEDDIFLGENAHFFLTSNEWIKGGIKIIKLETFLEKVFVGKSVYKTDHRTIYKLNSKHFGGAGYTLSKQIVDDLLNVIHIKKAVVPIDWVLFYYPIEEKTFDVFQLSPALCIQDKVLNDSERFESYLESDRVQYEAPKVKLKLNQKIQREILRLISQIKDLLFAKIIRYK